MTVSIRDVAKAAGVSVATVSKVFNGYADVNVRTRQRILDVAEELQYTPNLAARTLSSKKQKTIALILNDMIFTRKSTMPMEVLDGVHQFTEDTDFEFVFYGTTTKKQALKSFSQICRERNITGAVIQGLKLTDPYYKELLTTQIPTVMIDMDIANPWVGTVSIDNTRGVRQAVRHLIGYGHKRIGLVNGSKEAQVSIVREAGYRLAMEEANLDFEDGHIVYADYDEDKAFEKTKDLLLAYPDMTALMCASDVMAIGAMRAVQDMGLSIPQDISIIGFDNIILSEYVTPKLTTVDQNMKEMGLAAARLLAQMIDGNHQDRFVIVPHHLIERESVAPARNK